MTEIELTKEDAVEEYAHKMHGKNWESFGLETREKLRAVYRITLLSLDAADGIYHPPMKPWPDPKPASDM